jgi:hypothetical protein
MSSTKEKLQRLESILVEKKAPVLGYLNPGLGREEIHELFVQKKIEPRPDLIALYEWHNGVRYPVAGVLQPVIEIMPMGIFYDLDQQERSWKNVIRWNYMERPEEYLPLFGSGEDDLYLLRHTTGEIYYLSPAAGVYGDLQFKSLDDMLDLIIDCYEEGIFRVDPSRGLEADEYDYFAKMETYNK